MKTPMIFKDGAEEKMVTLSVSGYRNTDALFLILLSAEVKDNGRPFKDITMRPDEYLPPFHGAVLLDDNLKSFLETHELGRFTRGIVHKGFYTLKVFCFDQSSLMKYDPAGMEDYSEKYVNLLEMKDEGEKL